MSPGSFLVHLLLELGSIVLPLLQSLVDTWEILFEKLVPVLLSKMWVPILCE